MRWYVALLIYRIALPLLFLAAFPGWIVKMIRRGGFQTRLGERLGRYREPEPAASGAIHIHAVSVGESLLALKLVRAWQEHDPRLRFVLATGTATGHAVATTANIDGLTVTYAPLDFRHMVARYLDRFQPQRIVLIENEIWPHLMMSCRQRGIPVSLVNARMSPRSARRYRKLAPWLQPMFAMLDAVCIQEPGDAEIWTELGVDPSRIHHTGSLKFDPAGGALPQCRAEFTVMLDSFGNNRPVVLAASTHAGEEAWIAEAIRDGAPTALPVIVPRHAERRNEVKASLEHAGFHVVLRSDFHSPASPGEGPPVLVIDTTGELRDWTAHANVVIIGKSFFARGGQNPCEAVLAGKPVVFGPHMENFEPLASRLLGARGCLRADDEITLRQAIRMAMNPQTAELLTRRANDILTAHQGATRRIIHQLTQPAGVPN